jgi:hypothetical protein
VPGASISTIGWRVLLPVWVSVRSSYASSWVPNPPGKKTKASDSFTNTNLRVKKYLKLISRASST